MHKIGVQQKAEKIEEYTLGFKIVLSPEKPKRWIAVSGGLRRDGYKQFGTIKSTAELAPHLAINNLWNQLCGFGFTNRNNQKVRISVVDGTNIAHSTSKIDLSGIGTKSYIQSMDIVPESGTSFIDQTDHKVKYYDKYMGVGDGNHE